MIRHLRWITLLLGLSLLVACGGTQPGAPQAGSAVVNISVSDLKQKLDQREQFILLDVRTPAEYTNDGHIAGSQLLPLQELASKASTLPKDQPIVCFCRSGNRSADACEQLRKMGFTKLTNVNGGITAWAQAGYPIEK